jgi:large conductance mechanosensitive channel
MSMISEFKDFAMRGNVVDLAVGVVIGTAFGKIVTALVDKMIMPIIGWATSGQNFADGLHSPLGAKADGTPAVSIGYGAFLQSALDFVIVAFVLFLVIKTINRMKKKEAAAPAAPPAPTEQEKLLAEIRDLLKQR